MSSDSELTATSSASQARWSDIQRASTANNVALVAILLAAAFVRFYALDASSLWNDEGTTWALLSRSYPEIARNAAADIHPPGYYWLLKAWTTFAGTTAWAMRSLSVLLGVLLTFLVYRIGAYLESPHRAWRQTALLAALIAALNPFQIYYSQEARMYMLLAATSAGLFWALFALVRREEQNSPVLLPFVWYTACGIAGLWIHYSYPVVLASAGIAYLINLALRAPTQTGTTQNSIQPAHQVTSRTHRLVRFIIVNLIILLLYLPWLPTAIDRIVNWPKGGAATSLFDGLTITFQILVAGPIRSAPEIAWPLLLAAALLPAVGMWALRARFAGLALGIWWLSPIVLMFVMGLFSEAFLKFLLVASPAWCILVAAAPLCCTRPRPYRQASLAVVAVAIAVLVLPAYYNDPVARDNYAGVARYLDAIANPAQDIVVINAPGQQEVWAYYDTDLPTLPIPLQRPPDEAQTIDHLSTSLLGKRHAYALLWATDESDPEQIVEGWLDQNAYTSVDSWQGNMRFVVYTLAYGLECRELAVPISFGGKISLQKYCQPTFTQQVMPGDGAVVALHWQLNEPVDVSYKVSVQLLDSRDQVVAQHDDRPASGSLPTTDWMLDEQVVDNHGLPIPVGTPPGAYRLVVAVYDEATGERLTVNGANHIELGEVEVIRPHKTLPVEVVPIQHKISKQMGSVHLIGYEAYSKGFSHAPQTPLRSGDTVHLTLLWQAPDPQPDAWSDDMTFTIRLGDQSLTPPLAGGAYPTQLWQPGEIVRGEFDLIYDGTDNRPEVIVGEDNYRLKPLFVE